MNRLLAVFALALALAGCASAPAVHTDYDPSAQFASYRTYSWRQKPQLGPALTQQRIVDAIDAELRARGWNQVAEGGDVAVAAHVASRQEYDLDTFYDDPYWGGWGWHRPWWGMHAGYTSTRVRSYTVGTLIVDMFDTRTKQAVWSGIAEGTVSRDPAKVNADIRAAVTKMFAGFPPGSAPPPKS